MKKLSLLFFLCVLAFAGCKKDDDGSSGFGSSGSTVTTTIAGIILDENNVPVSNASVIANGTTVSTDAQGLFLFKNVSVNISRCILQISKTGFIKRSHAFIATANSVNYVKIILQSDAVTHTINASSGGTIALADGSGVSFSANSFVVEGGGAYSGTVNITFKHLSPDDVGFSFMIPGNDLLGKNSLNENVALYSYGMLGVILKGTGGEQLQLASGTTATLVMRIAGSQISTAPSTIPLLYFDEATSLWMQQGNATRVGNNYVGSVEHFSWWNCDFCGTRAYVKGKVIDCNGDPLSNINVSANGGGGLFTDANGEFYHFCPSDLSFNIQVLASNNSGMVGNSQIENIPPVSVGQIYIVPDLLAGCPAKVSGSIKKCSGESADGVVNVSWSSGSSFQYTNSGAFNISVAPNANVNLSATASYGSDVYSYHHGYVTPGLGLTLTAGNLLLCDNISSNQNYFSLDGSGFTNQWFIINPVGAYAASDSSGSSSLSSITIRVIGTAGSDTVDFSLSLTDTIPQTFNWGTDNYVFFSLRNTSGSYFFDTAGGHPGIINLAQFESVGGRVKGTYSGTGRISKNGGAYTPVILAGNFDVPRTQ